MRQKLFYEWAGRASEGAGGTAPCMCADACRFRYLHLYLTHAALVPGGNLAYFASMSLDDLREWCDLSEAQDEAVSRINDESLRDFAEHVSAERLSEYRDLLRLAEELGIDTGIVIDAILDEIRRSLEAP